MSAEQQDLFRHRHWTEYTLQERASEAFRASLGMIAWLRSKGIEPTMEIDCVVRAQHNLHHAGGMASPWSTPE